jgi:hypothetical protein
MPSFDFYEYVGYIVPGSILLVCVMSLCPWVRAQFSGGPAVEIGSFVIITFLLGHFLHFAAHSLEAFNRSSCEGGIYGQNILMTDPKDQHLLSQLEYRKFDKKINDLFDIDIKTLTPLTEKENLIAWCNVVLRIQDSVRHAQRGALLDTFVKDYGLYLGLTTAFALVFLLCLPLICASVVRIKRIPYISFRKNRFESIPLSRILLIAGAAVIGGMMSLDRLLYFGDLFDRELFSSFLAVSQFQQ